MLSEYGLLTAEDMEQVDLLHTETEGDFASAGDNAGAAGGAVAGAAAAAA